MELNLVSLLKDILEKEKTNTRDPFLEKEDIAELLQEDERNTESAARQSIVGYPTRPLYRELGTRMQQWYDTGVCPVLELPNFDLLDEKLYMQNRQENIDIIRPLLQGLKSLHSLWTQDEKFYSFRDVLVRLGKRGLLDILGLRKTIGSFDLWPPAREVLEATFCSRHSPQSESLLTVGARALAKHCHRDQTMSWWGNCTGSEQAKNDHAYAKMTNILDNAMWINIHQLPHDVKIIEARQENGYGVRWTFDGQQFRGFLEPQMIDGHDVGWRH